MGVAEVYQKTKKVPDFLWNLYVCRPVAAVFVHALRNTTVTPNQITLFALLVALGSAAGVVFAPGYWGLLFAVVIFELSYVLDCADGMLARLRGIQSTEGHLLDFLIDEIKAFVLLAAVAVRLWLERGDVWFLLWGLGGLVFLASGVSITTFQRRPEIAGASRATAPEGAKSLVRRLISLVERGARFLIHYPSYILFAAIAARMDVYLYVYVAVNGVYAARATLSVFWRYGRTQA